MAVSSIYLYSHSLDMIIHIETHLQQILEVKTGTMALIINVVSTSSG